MKSTRIQYANGWLRQDNVFSYPGHWQTPAKTEQWAYEECLSKVERNLFEQFICFPWATLVDTSNHEQHQKAKLLIAALNVAPPKMAVKRITFCQHIYALQLLPFFKLLGITDIYWSHKVIGQNNIEGITLHPFPLYPVMYYKRNNTRKVKPLSQRRYMYSFIGAYNPDLYLTPVRKWLFELPLKSDVIIIERSEWHFDTDVYKQQLLGITENQAEANMRLAYEKEYIRVMEDSVFCLCPSGSGPNSIRLWEAIKFGCIPIVFSDMLDLGNENLIRFNESKNSVMKLDHDLRKRALEIF